MKALRKKKLIFAGAAILAASLSSCGIKSDQTGKYTYFGTALFDVYLYNATSANLDYLSSYFSKMNDLTDAYTEPKGGVTSIYTINQTNDPVTVDDDLRDILKFALEMESVTEGYFNPLIGRLTTLWKAGIEAKPQYVPEQSGIDEALAEVKSSSLSIVGNVVTRTGNGLLDLGALAKGYSLREARRYLESEGVTNYLINAGTSSLALGKTKSGGDWKVSFSDYPTAYFKTSSTSIGTSSVSEQGMVIDGVTYSHIVNPFTGSAKADYVMVSIKGDDPGVDDVLSTVFMLGGPTLAAKFKDKYSLEYAFYDGTDLTFTSGMGVVVGGL